MTGKQLFGFTLKDRVNGFTGTATGVADYVTGCRQILVESSHLKDGEPVTRWIDETRLDLMPAEEPVKFPTAQIEERPAGPVNHEPPK